MSANLLAAETSPYLLQHRDNPVHWRPWGEAALAEAKRLDRPILLSVGYAACHWCHVMAHESFEDAAIAELMNTLFVNIKVDREERPDVDTLYQSALALTGQHGGWPLTMFLTPDGSPFWGGTYFPPEPRFGRPGFPDVLQQVAQVYRVDRQRVARNVDALKDGLVKMAQPQPGEGFTDQTLNTVATAALRLVDPIAGGTEGAPKFPQPLFFRFLWRAYRRTGSTLYRDAVTLTLDSIANGGIYDHLAGGYARYATDDLWLVPHFEKMLYDNALLVDLMTEAWAVERCDLYARRVRETIAWALGDLTTGDTDEGLFAFFSAFDADSEGVEGKYYVWTEAEVDAVLGDAAPLFKRVYDVTPGGNWEGSTILNRRRAASARNDDEERRLDDARARLLAVRRGRIPPARDDKVLADWNGLMITALVHAGTMFDHPEWVDAARRCFTFIRTRLEIDGRLRHTWCAGQARHPAVLDDYASMARAALALYEATGEAEYCAQAERWVAVADRHFWDAADGGYFQSADDTTDVPVRSKGIMDNAVPSGNGVMIDVLARLYHHIGDDRYRERADAAIRLFSADNPQYLMNVPGLLLAHDLLANGVQIVLIGDPADAATADLHRTAFAAAPPHRVITQVAPDTPLPPGHAAFAKTAIDGQPTAYVCVGPLCSPPVTTAAALRHTLAQA